MDKEGRYEREHEVRVVSAGWDRCGIAVGALGAVAVSKGKLDLKPLATDLISRGLDVKDAVLAKMETAKEDMDDLVAEARFAAEQRKETKESVEADEACKA